MEHIRIRGARVHNLKSLDVVIPRDQIVVLTGVSGSGKSSLAFDTIFAEGQRRYLESVSAYGRQLLGPLERADIDVIEGLSPTIAVRQQPFHESVRSTVGTITEIYDYLRVLFTHIGRAHCWQCGKAIRVHTVQQMIDELMELSEGTRIHVLAPVAPATAADGQRQMEEWLRAGFVRVEIDGEVSELPDAMERGPAAWSRLALVVDRLAIRAGGAKRLADSLEVALHHGHEKVRIVIQQGADSAAREFTRSFACVDCGILFPAVTPRFFSFNNPHGACPACKGLGREIVGKNPPAAVAGMCSTCGGSRLRAESVHVTVGGLSISALTALPVKRAIQVLAELELVGAEAQVSRQLLQEIGQRLNALMRMDLGYISLDRSADSLSGGESQRVRLARHLGSRLAGVIYVLDEPTVGLHPADTVRLLEILRELRNMGSSVLVVEHDRDVMLAADHVIDMGPGAGIGGGEIVVQGAPAQIAREASSVTGSYLAGHKRISRSGVRNGSAPHNVELTNVSHHNLRGIDVAFPIGWLTCVTGVSGAGKSTLLVDCLYEQARAWLASPKPKRPTGIRGLEQFRRVLYVDQSPIGRSPRSNPATYTGMFDVVRGLFARLPEARARGYGPGRFSANVKGGRCEPCVGEGLRQVEMRFLPDVAVSCEVCDGRRYNRETLEIRYKGANIADVLDLTVVEALEFLGNVPLVRQRLDSLWRVGLGYLRLGHPATMLSGGEAQRIKLARELGKSANGQTLYLFDEPTTGLHFDEVAKLMATLDRLLDAGHTVVCIEHNIDFVKCADFIIDLGPGGGAEGGRVVAQGTPQEVAAVEGSLTGQALRRGEGVKAFS